MNVMAVYPHVYRLDHKCLSNDHKFEIRNSDNEIEYVVHSNGCPFHTQLTLKEMSTGRELIKINKGRDRHHRIYEISYTNQSNNQNDYQHLATVKANHSHRTIEIDSIYGVYRVEHVQSDFDHQFQIKTGNEILIDVIQNRNLSKHENIHDIHINSNDPGGDLFLLAMIVTVWYAKRTFHL